MNNNWWTEKVPPPPILAERQAASSLRLLPLGLGESHPKFVVDPFTDEARFDWENLSQGRESLHPHARQRGRGQRLAAGAAARRNHGASAATAWGFLGLGSAITMMCMKYGVEEVGGVYPKCLAGNGRRGLGGGPWISPKRKGPAPIMKRGIHGDGAKMLRKRP